MPSDQADRDAVRDLLGRSPQGAFEIVVRGADGGPVVIRNEPWLDDGTPMPTTYWLVGRPEVRAVSRLESAGGVRRAEAAATQPSARRRWARTVAAGSGPAAASAAHNRA
jgi:hypothetical protein